MNTSTDKQKTYEYEVAEMHVNAGGGWDYPAGRDTIQARSLAEAATQYARQIRRAYCVAAIEGSSVDLNGIGAVAWDPDDDILQEVVMCEDVE